MIHRRFFIGYSKNRLCICVNLIASLLSVANMLHGSVTTMCTAQMEVYACRTASLLGFSNGKTSFPLRAILMNLIANGRRSREIKDEAVGGLLRYSFHGTINIYVKGCTQETPVSISQ